MCSFCTHGQKQYTKKTLYKGLLMFIELFELGKESCNINIIVYYIYANYTIYIQLTCIIYLNYFYWYHFGSS